MKAINIKEILPQRLRILSRSERKKINRYLSITFVAGSMILFFILSKKSTVDTSQISADLKTTANSNSLLEEKWMRVEIAFNYLNSLKNTNSSIQRQVAVNQVEKAQADMETQLQNASLKSGDVDAKRLALVYSKLLDNNKMLLALAGKNNISKQVTTLNEQHVDADINKNNLSESNWDEQLSQKNKQIDALKWQLQQQRKSMADKKISTNNNVPDINVSTLQNQLAAKSKQVENLKKQLQNINKTTPLNTSAASAGMFNYTSKDLSELQKQVKFFDWALKDMAQQNDLLKKEIQSLKTQKVISNR